MRLGLTASTIDYSAFRGEFLDDVRCWRLWLCGCFSRFIWLNRVNPWQRHGSGRFGDSHWVWCNIHTTTKSCVCAVRSAYRALPCTLSGVGELEAVVDGGGP